MTLQQLKYIVAIDRFRNFAKAAEACHISQPTLSAMLIKLEDELDVRIFERSNKAVKPTTEGEKIICQAQKALMEAGRITEIVNEGKGSISGALSLSVSPTIAPHLLPKFIKHYRRAYPSVSLSILEMKADFMRAALLNGEIDAGIAIADNATKGISEIPLYTEKFYVYLADNCKLKADQLDNENMWIMKEAQCLRDSAFSFRKPESKGQYIYEAGSIETLIRIVDENGGYTIIPEMHLPFLTPQQRGNVREIEGEQVSERRVSLYIKDDYIRQRMLNTITDTLKAFMPGGMLTQSIITDGIKL